MNEKDKHISLIFKYLTKEASDDEIHDLINWIDESKEHKLIFSEFKNAWNLSKQNSLSEINAVNIDKEWNSFKLNTGFGDISLSENLRKNKTFKTLRIAAVISLILALGITALFVLKPKQEIIFTELEIKDSKLPDGSEITVNKNTTIKYSKKYNQKNRKVQLEGDAFFKVKKIDSLPFIIDAQSFYVEVLGTEFYVRSGYKNRKVIVKEGTVAVYQFKDKHDKVILKTGEEIIFGKGSNEIRKVEIQNLNYLSWKTKIFNFEDTELDQIFTELEHVYNIHFEFINPELKNCRQTVQFKNQEIDEIINVLEATFDNLSFKRNNNTIFVDGEACNSF